jgi:hypothetical protein
MLCRFVSRPSNEHWQAIDRVLRYLRKGTINLVLHYQRFSVVLSRYIDADWNTLRRLEHLVSRPSNEHWQIGTLNYQTFPLKIEVLTLKK